MYSETNLFANFCVCCMNDKNSLRFFKYLQKKQQSKRIHAETHFSLVYCTFSVTVDIASKISFGEANYCSRYNGRTCSLGFWRAVLVSWVLVEIEKQVSWVQIPNKDFNAVLCRNCRNPAMLSIVSYTRNS